MWGSSWSRDNDDESGGSIETQTTNMTAADNNPRPHNVWKASFLQQPALPPPKVNLTVGTEEKG